MWYVYSTGGGRHIPLEFGYKAVLSAQIKHDYKRFNKLCQEGCPSYGSGGCPPWAPSFGSLQDVFPHSVLIFARFFSRFVPDQYKTLSQFCRPYCFQDIILSNLLNNLGYFFAKKLGSKIQFLTCGHCAGCAQSACSVTRQKDKCCNPANRAYSISATGIDIGITLAEILGIQLQWHDFGKDLEADNIFKIIVLLSVDVAVQNHIMNQIPEVLNMLPCTKINLYSPYQSSYLRTATSTCLPFYSGHRLLSQRSAYWL